MPDEEKVKATAKVSARLLAEVASKAPGEHVDLIIELAPPDVSAVTGSSRAERGEAIAAMKRTFESKVASVSERLSAVGGEVVDSAWINSTVRGRIPAGRVREIADDDEVEGLDLPAQLEPEH
jgi:hypothetical protein